MRELILTGHKDTWPPDEKQALFLGQHCLWYNGKYDFSEKNKFQIAPSPWKNARDMLDSALYIDELYDRIVPGLSKIMNSLYGLSYSDKFWNAYMVLWMHQWLNILYGRYRMLESMGESFKERFTVKILEEHYPVFTDVWAFNRSMIQNDYHNLSLMSNIISLAKFDFLDCGKISVKEEAYICNKETNPSIREIIKRHLNNFFTSAVFLGQTYGLSLKDKVCLQFLRDPAFLFKKKPGIPAVRVRKVTRSDLNNVHLEFGAKNRFEKIVEEILLKYVPDNILMLDEYSAIARPHIKTWVGNDIYLSQEKVFEIASVLERGGRWISSQHGGSYGQILSFPTGKYEYKTGGEFITWGWEHKHIYNASFYALPSPMLSRLQKNKETEDDLIFVTGVKVPYLHRLENYFMPDSLVDFVRNKGLFFECLNRDILKKLKYRPPHLNKYSSPQETDFIKKMLTEDQLLFGGRLTDFLSRARLAVIDHPSTGLLEALAMNTPVILYWDPAHFVFCEGAIPYFKKLADAGILFDNPKDAAEKVNEIWTDVKGWWGDPDIQRAKNDFCFKFARSQTDWRNEWAKFMKKL